MGKEEGSIMQRAEKGYEPSKALTSFHIHGFQHWDGALVLDQLKPGIVLELVVEPDNPYDPQAVALYLGGNETRLYSR